MADEKHYRADWERGEPDELDRELNAALAKYAAVELRAGLEQRILAQLRSAELRSDPQPAAGHAWWRWSLAAAAAVVLLAIALAWRSGKPARVTTVHPSPTSPTIQSPKEQAARVAADREENVPTKRRADARKNMGRRSRPTLTAQAKLPQFPSPQPLSPQEQMLASYVSQFHEEAVLVARARDQMLERDRAEELLPANAGADGSLQENNTTNK